MKRKFIIVLFITFILVGTSASAATFKGRVIDADTKEPIEGAVVVASWLEASATISGEDTRLKDVKETLTDKNGEWRIEGPKGSSPSNIKAIFTFITGIYYTRPPLFIVFKPGYCSWSVSAFGIDACRGKIKPIGNSKIREGETVELPKLTKREDRLRAQRISPSLMDGDREMLKKIKEFIRLKNEERKFLGLEAVDF